MICDGHTARDPVLPRVDRESGIRQDCAIKRRRAVRFMLKCPRNVDGEQRAVKRVELATTIARH